MSASLQETRNIHLCLRLDKTNITTFFFHLQAQNIPSFLIYRPLEAFDIAEPKRHAENYGLDCIGESHR